MITCTKPLWLIKKFDHPATKEVIRYKEAIWLGLKRLEEKPVITLNLSVEIVQCIKTKQSRNKNNSRNYTNKCKRSYYLHFAIG